MINDRMKYVVPTAAHNPNHFMHQVIFKEDLYDEEKYGFKHNREFIV